VRMLGDGGNPVLAVIVAVLLLITGYGGPELCWIPTAPMAKRPMRSTAPKTVRQSNRHKLV